MEDIPLRDFIEGMPANFLNCRIRHDWQPSRAVPVTAQGYIYTEEICGSCGLHKHQEMSLFRVGHLLSRWYTDYPEGYLAPESLSTPDRNYLRYTRIMRAFPVDKLTRREQLDEIPHSGKTRAHIEEHTS